MLLHDERADCGLTGVDGFVDLFLEPLDSFLGGRALGIRLSQVESERSGGISCLWLPWLL